MNKTTYQVVQAIAGRTRIRIPWLKTHEEAAGKLQRLVESLDQVTSVRINPLAQSIIVFYRARAISPKELEAQLVNAIQQASPFATSAETPVATPVESPVSASAGSPLFSGAASAVQPPSSSTVVAETAATDGAGAKPATVTFVEIPSPWDDLPESAPQPQPAAEATAEVSPKSPPPVPEVTPAPEIAKSAPIAAKSVVSAVTEASLSPHSTASLAKRLNTTSQAITHRRNRSDFPTWTQSQDPDRIAWKYNAAAQSFEPVDPTEPSTPVAAAIAPKQTKKATKPSTAEVSKAAPETPESPPELPKKRTTTRPSTKSKKPGSRRSSKRQ